MGLDFIWLAAAFALGAASAASAFVAYAILRVSSDCARQEERMAAGARLDDGGERP